MKKHTFTLVELILIVGILTLMISMLGTVSARTLAAAQKEACMNSLKAMGKFMFTYIDNSDGFWPATYTDESATAKVDEQRAWMSLLVKANIVDAPSKLGQLGFWQDGGYNDRFNCENFCPAGATHTNWKWSYAMPLTSEWAGVGGRAWDTPTQYTNKTNIKNPAETVALMESGGTNNAPFAIAAETGPGYVTFNNHGDGSNYLYADGSVRSQAADYMGTFDHRWSNFSKNIYCGYRVLRRAK
ncbi:MAG: hypothetical protein LBM70_02455 [Victivallales bacterium]|jgi:prepilin-type processing-associated H-X9-DG protein|nr:hypothetical protein [Victivallales bacterium]